MKFIHTGDLHIGKSISDFSLLEDQRAVLGQIAERAEEEKADAVVLAGDIYDRAVPPAEAVEALDAFLTRLAQRGIAVLMISGNHDSPERLGFAGEILQGQGVHIAASYKGALKQVTLRDAYGPVTFVLMPFVKPSSVQAATAGEAVERMLGEAGLLEDALPGARRVLVTHYFVTDGGRGPELTGGESTVQVGGIDSVEASLFSGFDYVALGHIHRPQQIGERPIYYAGAPLAFSFSEAGAAKSMNLVELAENGELTVRRLPFSPLRGMRVIRGRLEELVRPDVVEAADRNDYIQAVLTDEAELIDPMGTLRGVYPNVMQILLSKNLNKEQQAYEYGLPERKKSIAGLFADFYKLLREEEPGEAQRQIMEQAAEEAGERL